jgi:hypothetical protein
LGGRANAFLDEQLSQAAWAVREEGRQLRGVAASSHRADLLENVKTSKKLFTDNL